MNDQGLKIIKFERELKSQLQYTFIRSYPRSITSMPVTYDGSSLLKCSVQMSYIRYVMRAITNTSRKTVIGDPFQQAAFNSNGLSNLAATVADNVIDRITGNDFLGDVAGGLARRAVGNLF